MTPSPFDDLDVRCSPARVAKLLARYPEVSDRERREILAFIRNGTTPRIGVVSASDELRPQLDAFIKDHKVHLQISLAHIVRLMAVLMAAMMVCWLLWELVHPASR